jgi:hypothetical protein
MRQNQLFYVIPERIESVMYDSIRKPDIKF